MFQLRQNTRSFVGTEEVLDLAQVVRRQLVERFDAMESGITNGNAQDFLVQTMLVFHA